MSAKLGSAIVTVILVAGILSAASARAQDGSAFSLVDRLKTKYKLAKMGTDSNITEAGTVLVIQTEGILAVPSGSDVCPATYSDGAMRTPSAADQTRCGKDARKLSTGERVYALKIDVNSKKDTVSLVVVGCGSCNGTSQSTSYKSQIVFQFPFGYLADAELDQIGDVIGQVLKIDNGTNDAQRQVHDDHSASAVLTNEDIIKLAQARLPDSIVLAKIKSSNCDFDTSTEALIKLQQARVSEPVLQAIVDAAQPSNSPDGFESASPRGADCTDYGSCISSGNTALSSAHWEDAITAFQTASTLDASKSDAWVGIGNAYLGASRKEEAVAIWNKALSLGGSLTLVVCRPGFGGSCQSDLSDRGNLSLGPKLVSFITSAGKTVFAVSPSEVTSAEVSRKRVPLVRNELHLKIKGKNYIFYFVPFGIDCGKGESAYCEEDEAVAQQLAVFNYVSQAIPKLASGTFGSSLP